MRGGASCEGLFKYRMRDGKSCEGSSRGLGLSQGLFILRSSVWALVWLCTGAGLGVCAF